ncbi:MAG: 4Fe-4S binding protein, partial [Bacteroidetes bacterium]|nr:4Fe-4S binding protein [Bacteroidota bacterium]
MENNPSLSISDSDFTKTDNIEKLGLSILSIGLVTLMLIAFKTVFYLPHLFSTGGILVLTGALLFIFRKHLKHQPGIQNNHIWHTSITSGGFSGWLLAIAVTSFYIIIYWFPSLLNNLVKAAGPLSFFLRGKEADRWFLYGTIYTVMILIMGLKAILKYRHSNYQIVRTISVMFFQLAFAYLIPAILQLFNQPEFYFNYFWPLKYDYLFPSTVHSLISHPGGLGVFMVFWGTMMTFIATPILTYFFGKRWYCSWVCGCGGLANTAGDPFRQLSNKSTTAWKIERWIIYSVLIFIIITTALLWINSYQSGALLGSLSKGFAKTYGFLIGAVFSGVIGVGFYPIMGSRVWCRFGCPMAAILGLQQRFFSRFR